MTYKNLLLLLYILPGLLFAQEEKDKYQIPDTIPFSVDSLYREDQFYAGFHFNLITKKPPGVS
ncbi:MAG: PorT family protein, partial [Gramella sp.]|nr:PorT family protein [Christiangramia sp.]